MNRADALTAAIEAELSAARKAGEPNTHKTDKDSTMHNKTQAPTQEDLTMVFGDLIKQTPPADTGIAVATIRRGDDQELRIRIKEHKGSAYTSLEKWTLNPGGGWWPAKSTVSVRNSELLAVAAALMKVYRNLESSRPDDGE
jgi:hypothetical protein